MGCVWFDYFHMFLCLFNGLQELFWHAFVFVLWFTGKKRVVCELTLRKTSGYVIYLVVVIVWKKLKFVYSHISHISFTNEIWILLVSVLVIISGHHFRLFLLFSISLQLSLYNLIRLGEFLDLFLVMWLPLWWGFHHSKFQLSSSWLLCI